MDWAVQLESSAFKAQDEAAKATAGAKDFNLKLQHRIMKKGIAYFL
jgi:hypothetical protein